MINQFLNIGLMHYLILSSLLFFVGIIGVVVSRNLLRIVMSLFIMTISIVLNFTSFGYYCDDSLKESNIINIFIILSCVIQSIIAIVILYKIHLANEYLDAEQISDKER